MKSIASAATLQPNSKAVHAPSLVPAPASLRALRCTDDMVRSLFLGTRTQMRLLLDVSRLRVRLPSAVHSDLPDVPELDHLEAVAGMYRATMNSYGAVSARIGKSTLGLRPGEFHFVCPYAAGDTILGLYGKYGKDDKRWTIIPRGVNLLWVQEAFAVVPWLAGADLRDPADVGAGGTGIRYRATWAKAHSGKWASSSRMARRLSRIALQVESVRIERVHSISEDDARAEGVERREHFARRFDETHGEGSFDSNPWVSTLTFRMNAPTAT